MSEPKTPAPSPPPQPTDPREKRLAEALRANLRRRKGPKADSPES
jgi:hypothetical protein